MKSPNLKAIDVGVTAVSTNALVKLVNAQTEIKALGLSHSPISDKDLISMDAKLSTLESLNLCNTTIQSEGKKFPSVFSEFSSNSLLGQNLSLTQTRQPSFDSCA